MIRKPGKQGAITVFAALSFMLIAQLLLVLAEGCRQMEMVKIAEMNTDSAAESLLAQYCRPLWDDYHLLSYDAGGSGSSIDTESMENELTLLTESNFAVNQNSILGGTNLLRMEAAEVAFPEYTLLTDDSGNIYVKTVSAYMQQNLAYEAAKKIYNNYEAVKNLEENNKYDSGAVNKAISALQKIAGSDSSSVTPSPSSSEGKKSNTSPSTELSAAADENVLSEVAKKQSSGILTLVLPSSATVSGAKMKLSDTVSGRSLAKGVSSEAVSVSWYDKVLLQQYLVSYMSDYSNPAEDGALNYEIEYLLGGKATDEANLKAAAAELLAVREAANMAYIAGNKEMQAEITAAAAAIGGASLNPVVIKVIKIGLIAAWAFCESVLDVRALLAGRKINLMKSSATWTSSLDNLSELLDGSLMAKNCSGGLSYSDYLGILLFAKSTEKLAMRAMDLQEMAIRKMDHYEDFRMDHCICSMETEISYIYHPIFYSFITLITIDQNEYAVVRKSKMSYLSKST